jgi:hypothetical protein
VIRGLSCCGHSRAFSCHRSTIQTFHRIASDLNPWLLIAALLTDAGQQFASLVNRLSSLPDFIAGFHSIEYISYANCGVRVIFWLL